MVGQIEEMDLESVKTTRRRRNPLNNDAVRERK